jgi:hypothetical protein
MKEKVVILIMLIIVVSCKKKSSEYKNKKDYSSLFTKYLKLEKEIGYLPINYFPGHCDADSNDIKKLHQTIEYLESKLNNKSYILETFQEPKLTSYFESSKAPVFRAFIFEGKYEPGPISMIRLINSELVYKYAIYNDSNKSLLLLSDSTVIKPINSELWKEIIIKINESNFWYIDSHEYWDTFDHGSSWSLEGVTEIYSKKYFHSVSRTGISEKNSFRHVVEYLFKLKD